MTDDIVQSEEQKDALAAVADRLGLVYLPWLSDELESLAVSAAAPGTQDGMTALRSDLRRIADRILEAQHETLHRVQVSGR